MDHTSRLIERVSRAMFEDATPHGDWAFVDAKHRVQWRVDARTVVSAWECGQSALDAAKRLAIWSDVDNKRPARAWSDHLQTDRERFMRRAKAGFESLNGRPSTQEQEPIGEDAPGDCG